MLPAAFFFAPPAADPGAARSPRPRVRIRSCEPAGHGDAGRRGGVKFSAMFRRIGASENTGMAAEITASRVQDRAPPGSASAEVVMRQHERWLRGVIYAVTGRLDLVDDVLQEVWIRVCQQIGSVREPQRLRGWLYRVARNAAIDARRGARRREAVPLEAVEGLVVLPSAGAPPARVMRSELRENLLRAVEALPALYREPFVLRHLEGWSYARIGEVLGLSVETVETRLVRARRLLREMLDGKAG